MLDAPPDPDREAALRDIDAIAQGACPINTPIVQELLQCPDSQRAADLLLRAVGAHTSHPTSQPLFLPPAILAPPPF